MAKRNKRSEAEATLPRELLGAFDELVKDYEQAAEAYTGQKWVNYYIVADLIRNGWRKSK